MKREKAGEKALFPRPSALALAEEALGAPSLRDAARVIRAAGQRLPPTVDKRGLPSKRLGWKEAFARLADRLARGEPFYRVFITEGNTKLPFSTFSTLPLFSCPGMGECGAFCFSLKAWGKPSGYGRQLQNTLLLRWAGELVEKEFLLLPEGVTFRLYVDGDFASEGEVAFWMGLLKRRPDIRAYGYSKSWDELWGYGQGALWPPNYLLNLSSGGREREVSREMMATLPVTRGGFLALETDYVPRNPDGSRRAGNVGFARYDDPAFRKAARKAARKAGLTKFFVCPGKCGDCTPRGHACGLDAFRGVPIVNPVH